jgi:ABC-type polysaccharide/polyol phosphate transport system ATPase subunit
MSDLSTEKRLIEVTQVHKTYYLYKNRYHSVLGAMFSPLRKLGKPIKALEDISFTIESGEFIGIIGKNGSGKSTLLKTICGIVEPSSGSISVNGSIRSILELGAGLHPELTGRENISFYAFFHRIPQELVNNMTQEIIAFSEIGEFIDAPLKKYSSGMVVRLAFAICTHLKSDILVIDEALAVGDESFRKKCFKKINQIKQNNTTIIFVSHSMDQIKNHCTRVIYLKQGKIACDNKPSQVIEHYLAQDNKVS